MQGENDNEREGIKYEYQGAKLANTCTLVTIYSLYTVSIS